MIVKFNYSNLQDKIRFAGEIQERRGKRSQIFLHHYAFRIHIQPRTSCTRKTHQNSILLFLKKIWTMVDPYKFMLLVVGWEPNDIRNYKMRTNRTALNNNPKSIQSLPHANEKWENKENQVWRKLFFFSFLFKERD